MSAKGRDRILRRITRGCKSLQRLLDRQAAAVDGVLATLDEIDAGARSARK